MCRGGARRHARAQWRQCPCLSRECSAAHRAPMLGGQDALRRAHSWQAAPAAPAAAARSMCGLRAATAAATSSCRNKVRQWRHLRYMAPTHHGYSRRTRARTRARTHASTCNKIILTRRSTCIAGARFTLHPPRLPSAPGVWLDVYFLRRRNRRCCQRRAGAWHA